MYNEKKMNVLLLKFWDAFSNIWVSSLFIFNEMKWREIGMHIPNVKAYLIKENMFSLLKIWPLVDRENGWDGLW